RRPRRESGQTDPSHPGPPSDSTRPAGRCVWLGENHPPTRGFVMADRFRGSLGAFIPLCLALPGTGRAQEPKPVDPPGPDLIRRHDWEGATTRAPYPEPTPNCNWEIGLMTAPGYYHSGWPYGPRVAPEWGY